MRTLPRPSLTLAATALWLAVAAAGMVRLGVYATTPGDTGATADAWPGGGAVPRRAGTPTLVVALHPACTCSQATVDQLGALMAAHPGAFDVVALLARYPALPADADVIGPALARRPDIRRVDDPGGAIAARFGALTSGHGLLYDADGRLRFTGGLTRARGEAGDSVSLSYLHAWAAGTRPAEAASFRVFGCALSAHGAAS